MPLGFYPDRAGIRHSRQTGLADCRVALLLEAALLFMCEGDMQAFIAKRACPGLRPVGSLPEMIQIFRAPLPRLRSGRWSNALHSLALVSKHKWRAPRRVEGAPSDTCDCGGTGAGQAASQAAARQAAGRQLGLKLPVGNMLQLQPEYLGRGDGTERQCTYLLQGHCTVRFNIARLFTEHWAIIDSPPCCPPMHVPTRQLDDYVPQR